jgi:hypothetical protein
MHHIVYNTLQHKKESSRAIAVVCVVGVGATTSRRAVELVQL